MILFNSTSAGFLSLLTCSLLAAAVSGQTAVSTSLPVIESNSSRFRFTGTITSERTADISPRVAGLVAMADAEMGFEAKKGDVLVSLDDTLARMDLQEKKLNLEAARAELINARRRLDEAVSLGDANFPRSERENRETTHRMAEIAVTRLETIVKTQEEIVERHRIPAPFDGVVVAKMAEVGEWVQSGNPVLRFIDSKNLRLDVQIPQERLPLVMNTRDVQVAIGGFRDQLIDAHIEARSPLIDPQTRNFQVRIYLDDPPAFVKPGMSAEAVFLPNGKDTRLFISRDALLRTAEGQVVVWVAEETGQGYEASRRIVNTGRTNGDLIEITGGLTASDSIIYQGNESLLEGQEIRVVNSVTPLMR